VRYTFLPSHSSRFYHPNNTGWGVQTSSIVNYLPFDTA
jgi:hypothetical protein